MKLSFEPISEQNEIERLKMKILFYQWAIGDCQQSRLGFIFNLESNLPTYDFTPNFLIFSATKNNNLSCWTKFDS